MNRKKNIGKEPDDTSFRRDPPNRPFIRFEIPSDIVQVHRFRKVEVGIRIEPAGKFFTLVLKVFLYVKPAVEVIITLITMSAPEALCKLLLRPV